MVNGSSANTIARPYAKALFELAVAENSLKEWSQLLEQLARIAASKEMQKLYGNPNVDATILTQLFLGLLNNQLSAMGKNLIDLLAHYKRLSYLPEIAQLFTEHYAALEKIVHATLISPWPVSETIRQQCQKALEIRLQRAVVLQVLHDHTLLGGAIIRVGDLVIDASVKTKLERLRQALMS